MLQGIANIKSIKISEYHAIIHRFINNEIYGCIKSWSTQIANGNRDFANGQVRGTERQLILYKDQWVSIGLRAISPGKSPIEDKIISASPLDIENYLVSEGKMIIQSYPIDQWVDGRPRLKKGGILEISKNESFSLAANEGSYEVLSMEGNVVLLELACGIPTSTVWHFEKSTLLPKYCTASDSHAKRCQIALKILEKISPQNISEPALNLIRSSPHHYLRWEAARTLARVGYSDLASELKRLAASDPHSQVRSAATASLIQINGGGST